MRLSVQEQAFDAGAELNAFTTRNVGRACSIEMDRDDFGAQSLGHGMPLVGATYDKHDRSISLMFGASSLLGECFFM